MRKQAKRIGKNLCAIDGIYWKISKLSGLKENLFWLLYALDDDEVHTQKQICNDWLLPKTTINTLIKECEAAGYITLQALPGRKRELQICLTEKGSSFAEQTLKTVYKIEHKAITAVLKKSTSSFITDLELYTNELRTAYETYKQSERT